MKRNLLSLAALVGAFTPCFASYELLAVCDTGNGGSVPAAIHRFDPVSKSYLGSFGAGIVSSPWSVALSPSDGMAYVTEFGSTFLHKFSYSTGVYYGKFNLGWAGAASHSIVYKGGFLYGTDFGANNRGIWRVNLGSMVATPIVTPENTGSASWIAKSTGNLLYTGQYVNGTTLDRLQAFDTSTGTWKAPTKVGGIDSNIFADAVHVPDGSGSSALYRMRASASDMQVHGLSGSGAWLATTPLNSSTIAVPNAGAALAHGGFYAGGNNQVAGTGGIVTFFDNYGAEKYSFGQSYLLNPTGMDSVIAPEPSSAAALVVFAGLWLRRRRN